MKKIRINELARELEVKPGIILDLLPELGVQEKKTDSSSIEEVTAIALRERLAESGFLGSFPNRANGHHDGDEAEPADTSTPEAERSETPASAAAPAAEPVRPPALSGPAPSAPLQRFPLRAHAREAQAHTEASPRGIAIPPAHTPSASAGPEAATEAALSAVPSPVPEPERPSPRFQPLRPPLGAGGSHPAPAAPSPASAPVPSQPAPAASSLPAPSAPLNTASAPAGGP